MKEYIVNNTGSGTTSGIKTANHFSKQLPTQTSTLSNNYFYMQKLPTNIDVLSKVYTSINSLSDKSVKNYSINLLNLIYLSLSKANDSGNITNYLSRLYFSEQEDKSALIEWNFENFRIGFSVEPNVEESSYYFVSQDRELGRFTTDTRRINNNAEMIVDALVNYVLGNT